MKAKWKQFTGIDRLLIIIVLIVQCVIIFQYLKDKRSQPSNTEIRPYVTAESDPAGNKNLLNMRLPLPPGYDDKQMRSRDSIDDIFSQMQNQMNTMMRRAQMDFDRLDNLMSMNEDWNTLIRSPTMDIENKPDRYIIYLSIPGENASDFSVSLDGRLLSINGKYEMQDTMGKSAQLFERRVLLPTPVSSQNISKSLSDKGVLRISIMKIESEDLAQSGRDLNTYITNSETE